MILNRQKLPSLKKLTGFLLAGFCAACLLYVLWLPDVREFKTANPKTSAFIDLRREQAAGANKKFVLRMRWTPLESISPDLVHAVLVAEDEGFYRHHGIEWELTKAAFRKDLKKRKFAVGASTITQQLARNLYLSPSKNPLRKIKEFLIARRLEKQLGKKRILELYLNIAEWGKGVFGVGAAAEVYFGKSAAALDVEEASALASVLPSPRKWNPLKKGSYADRRAQSIVRRMKASGYLEDRDEAEPDAPAEPAAEPVGTEPQPVAVSTSTAEAVTVSSVSIPAATSQPQ